MLIKLLLSGALAAFVAMTAPASVRAQEYPSKPIRIVIPAATAGVTDYVARLMGQKLSDRVGQPVVSENKPGAGGNLGAETAARAAPDGYTLFLGFTAPFSVNPWLFKNMTFDGLRDFVPLVQVTSYPMVLAVHPSVPAKTVGELLALAKRDPKAVSVASAGIATTSHLTLELLKSESRAEMLHVPYKGEAAGIVATIAGDVQATFATANVVMPHAPTGKLKVLGITSRERSPSFPDVPTFAEGGMKDFEVTSWYGFFAPAGTPAPIVERLTRELTAILADPSVRSELDKRGQTVVGTTGKAFADAIAKERTMWQRVIAASRISLN